MATSHITAKSLPSTSNYVFTASGSIGKGTWSNPASNPLITALVPSITTSNYHVIVPSNGATANIRVTSDGSHVIVDLIDTVGQMNSPPPFIDLSSIPIGFRPTNQVYMTGQVINNGVYEVGQFTVGTSGQFYAIRINQSAFDVGVGGFVAQSLSYWIVRPPGSFVVDLVEQKLEIDTMLPPTTPKLFRQDAIVKREDMINASTLVCDVMPVGKVNEKEVTSEKDWLLISEGSKDKSPSKVVFEFSDIIKNINEE